MQTIVAQAIIAPRGFGIRSEWYSGQNAWVHDPPAPQLRGV